MYSIIITKSIEELEANILIFTFQKEKKIVVDTFLSTY